MTAEWEFSSGDDEEASYAVPPTDRGEGRSRDHEPGRNPEDAEDDVEAELMLLALTARDTGEPTQDIDLSSLTTAEKHALLALWRDRLGMAAETRGAEDDGGDEGQR